MSDLEALEARIWNLTAGRVVYSGAGTGQRATVHDTPFGTLTGRGRSKLAAAEALMEIVADAWSKAQSTPRVNLEQVLDMLANAGFTPDVAAAPEDKDQPIPGPVWDGNTLVSFTPCVPECMASKADFCDCRCFGANHGIGRIWLDGGSVHLPDQPVMLGEKKCLCGCGETTQRRFRPGHDARYHAAQKRAEKEAASAAA